MVSYLTTAILAVGVLAAAPQSPKWETSYGKALEETRESESPLLVVLDNPESREALDPELLSDGELAGEEAELLESYKLCHVDVTTKYGKKVAKAFRAKSFPHIAIIDKTGSTVIFRKTGQVDSAEWQRILKRHKSGERTIARAVPQRIFSPADSISRPYCPNCQRNSF